MARWIPPVFALLPWVLASPAGAQTRAEAEVAVFVTVPPVVEVVGPNPRFVAVRADTGRAVASPSFGLRTNCTRVALFVECTALYPEPAAGSAEPLRLDEAAGVAVALAGSGDVLTAAVTGPGAPIAGLPTVRTEPVVVVGDEGRAVRGEVEVTITWRSPDGGAAAGRYGAWVRLTALVPPD